MSLHPPARLLLAVSMTALAGCVTLPAVAPGPGAEGASPVAGDDQAAIAEGAKGPKGPGVAISVKEPEPINEITAYFLNQPPEIVASPGKSVTTADHWSLTQTFQVGGWATAGMKLQWKVSGGATWPTGTPPAAPADATYPLAGAWVKVDASKALAPVVTVVIPRKAGVPVKGSVRIELTATNARGKAVRLDFTYGIDFDGAGLGSAGWGGGILPVTASGAKLPTATTSGRIQPPIDAVPSVIAHLTALGPRITASDYKAEVTATAITLSETYQVATLDPADVKLDWQVGGGATWTPAGRLRKAPADAAHKLTGAWVHVDESKPFAPRIKVSFPYKAGVRVDGKVDVGLTATNAKGKGARLKYGYAANYDATRAGAYGGSYGGGGTIEPVPAP